MVFCLYPSFGVAQVASFEVMKSQLDDKSLPLVNLTVAIDKVSKPEYTDAVLELADPQMRTDGQHVSTIFNCKVKYRGSSSLKYEKKSFAVKLLDDKGKSLDADMFGIRKDDAWILDAMAIDRLRMRNRMNFDVWNSMSMTPYATDYGKRNGTEGLFVELFINGEYHGLYCFSDKVNRKLLGIKKVETDDEDNPVIRGVMYKASQWSDATKLIGYQEESMYGASWNQWELDYPDDYPCPDAYQPLQDFIDYVVGSSEGEFAAGIDNRFYWQNFIDYHVFMLAVGLTDNHMKNTFLSIVNTKKGRCVMMTPWDLDCSLGGTWTGAHLWSPADNEEILSVGLYDRLWNNDVNGYKAAVAGRWQELRTNVLSEEAFNERQDAYADSFIESGAWQREYDRWNGNPVELQRDFTQEVEYVKDWYRRNCDHIDHVIFKGIVDGIASPTVAADPGRATAEYDLSGRRVGDAYRGIVISGGKKFLRR